MYTCTQSKLWLVRHIYYLHAANPLPSFSSLPVYGIAMNVTENSVGSGSYSVGSETVYKTFDSERKVISYQLELVVNLLKLNAPARHQGEKADSGFLSALVDLACFIHLPSIFSFAGVKETFLKVAQGVIALFQCNELVANNVIEPSYSPLNSCTPTQHLYSSPHYHQSQPSHLEPNGRVTTAPYDRRSSTNSQDSFFHKCCGG